MKVFTIAKVETKCHGHGDYTTDHVIRARGAYGTKGFAPVFRSREAAEKWLSENRDLGGEEIVELEFIE